MWLGPKVWLSESVGFQPGTFQSRADMLPHCVTHPYIDSVVKNTSKKIIVLIHSLKFPFTEAAFYLCNSTIQSGIEYCYQI